MCGRVFQGKRAPPSGPERSHRDPGEPDNRHCYHCPRCKFDICTACFKGHLHTFHRHRLKKARTTVVYKSYEGLWHCDACGAVHSEYTQQLCYHCEKCEVDLCNTCFEGKWEHSLHGSDMSDTHKHTLRPIDPSIEYRTYQEWICDNCDRRFSCQRDAMTAFHCDECNFDLCKTCHSGYKHPFHPHPVVSVETRQHSRSMFECSNCELPIRQATHYQCVKRTCQYRLCVKCFSKQPELHPFHNHPLEVCGTAIGALRTAPTADKWHCRTQSPCTTAVTASTTCATVAILKAGELDSGQCKSQKLLSQLQHQRRQISPLNQVAMQLTNRTHKLHTIRHTTTS